MAGLEGLKFTDEDRPFVEQLFKDYGASLTSHCSWLVGLDAAGDVLQQVFLELIENPKYLEDLRGYSQGHREGWLRLTMYRKALLQLKQWGRAGLTGETPESPEAKDPIDSWLAAKHALTLLEQVRQTLGERESTLLQVWLDLEEKRTSYAQAATELDMEADALRQAVHRMVDPEKGHLRGAVLTVYLHDTQGGGCRNEKLRKAVSGELNAQLRSKVVRHVAKCSHCQDTRRELPVLAGVHGTLPLLLPAPQVHERLVREVGYATSMPKSPAATAASEPGTAATVMQEPKPTAAETPAMVAQAAGSRAATTRRVPTRRRRRSLLLLLLLLLGVCTVAPTYAAHLYQSALAPMTHGAAPANAPERIVPSNIPQPRAKVPPASTTAPPLKIAPSNTTAPPIHSGTPARATAAPSTTTIASVSGPTLPTPTLLPPPAVSAPPKTSPPSAGPATSPTIGLTKPAPVIIKPLATAIPCGLHVSAAVTNATSSAVNYLLPGAARAIVVPLDGSPSAANLYPLDRPGPGEFTENLQVTWWISATNGTKMVFTLGVTQTVAVCDHFTPVH